MRRSPLAVAPFLVAAAVASGAADEGMWTFNQFPRDKVKQRYGFAPDDAWLDHVRLSSARLAQGCSASFVSPSGLLLTNHHCVSRCIEQLSTKDKDLHRDGFYAASEATEARCPELEVNQLSTITDVTERVLKAVANLPAELHNEAEKGEMSRIEKECVDGDKKPGSSSVGGAPTRTRCDVVRLYQGGAFHLYKYHRYQDVRLVFAPEGRIAHFGGDPDNFNFPRFCLDAAFLRAYEDGKPAPQSHFLSFSPAGVKEGDLTFVSGHPGNSSRKLTVAELTFLRDLATPDRLLYLAQLRGTLTEFGHRGPEARRIVTAYLHTVENTFKALRGRETALRDGKRFAEKVAAEQLLRANLKKNLALDKELGGAWDEIARAEDQMRRLYRPYVYLEELRGFPSDLFRIAWDLARAAEERPKPLEKRFREYRDSALPALTQRLFSTGPIHDELEIVKLSFGLTRLREELGADHPVVTRLLGRESPEELATRLVQNTQLKDVAVRKRLWEGGAATVAASEDPMIRFARNVDLEARSVRKLYEDQVEGPIRKHSERIAKARFAVDGTGTYPDATFTLRLSYGAVAGWYGDGGPVKPLTTFAGAFERATERPPFDLPERWQKAKGALDLATPLDVATTNDIIGGNSGSPMIGRDGKLVGLVFDGNLASLAGDYWFDETVNRAVAVEAPAILHALDKVYRTERLLKELRPK